MGAGHGHHLHHHGHSPVHRLPPQVKVVSLVAFVVIVVATPREQYWAFAAYLLILLAVLSRTGIPFGYVARRMVVEVPFVAFALLMPFIATGPRVQVGPVEVSELGLLGAWSLLAKGTLGVLASLVVGTTTEPRDLVAGLERLRLPGQLVQIMAFMMRYLEVVTGELSRMRIARESRGFRARSLRAWPALASTAGALFIRSYERGERIHLAMLARGYSGTMPTTRHLATTRPDWLRGGAVPALALAVCLTAVAR